MKMRITNTKTQELATRLIAENFKNCNTDFTFETAEYEYERIHEVKFNKPCNVITFLAWYSKNVKILKNCNVQFIPEKHYMPTYAEWLMIATMRMNKAGKPEFRSVEDKEKISSVDFCLTPIRAARLIESIDCDDKKVTRYLQINI